MEGSRILRNTQIIVLGFCIAIATIFSSIILSKTMIKIKKFTDEVISVTGSAEKKIISDYSVWKISFARRDKELPVAYAGVKKDLERIKAYLISQGFKDEEIVISQLYTETLYKKNKRGYDTNKIGGYRITQTLEMRSNDVQKATLVCQKITELINEGIGLISDPPQYFYTKISDLKLEMLAQATEDAKSRAVKMAGATGNKIGLMHSASMGVFQITPVNSTEVAGYGINDTTSLEKKVTAVVHADFGIGE